MLTLLDPTLSLVPLFQGLLARSYKPRALPGTATAPSFRPLSSFDTPEGTTLSRQAELQRYGVPDLNETLAKFVQSSKPFVSAEELETTAKRVQQMQEPGSVAQKCHELLKQKAAVQDNWVGSENEDGTKCSHSKMLLFSLYFLHAIREKGKYEC